jgi:hypothetical protein
MAAEPGAQSPPPSILKITIESVIGIVSMGRLRYTSRRLERRFRSVLLLLVALVDVPSVFAFEDVEDKGQALVAGALEPPSVEPAVGSRGADQTEYRRRVGLSVTRHRSPP